MLYMPKSKFHRFPEVPLHSSVTSLVEGAALVDTSENGTGVVTASVGDATDKKFAGFSMSQFMAPATGIMVEELVIPASGPYTFDLKNTPLNPATEILAKLNGINGSVMTYDNTPDATLDFWNSSGKTLTFHSSDAGKTVYVVYRYSLSAAQIQALTGESHVLGVVMPTDVTRSCTCIKQGIVYTDQFNTGVDWTEAAIADIKTGAGGYVTRGGAGAAINARVVQAPSADFPYLGLDIVAA